MKLCPQCEFIYEDDQRFCDMDGEALVFDTRSGASITVPSATGARLIKSRLRIIVVFVVAGLVVSGLFLVAYYASSASRASRNREPEAAKTNSQRQLSLPVDNSSSQPGTKSPELPGNPEAASESASISADELTDRPAEPARRQVPDKATDNTLKTREKRLAIARDLPPLPQVKPLPRLAPLTRLPAAKPEAKLPGSTSQKQGLTNEKSPVTSQKALVVDVKPAPVNANKQSRVRAFFKKTGRILKKPFQF